MNETEAREMMTEAPRPMPRPAPQPPAAAPTAPHVAPVNAAPSPPVGFEPMVLVPTERPPEPMPSTESASFHEVLARLAAELPTPAPQPEPVPAPVVEAVVATDDTPLGFEPIDIQGIAALHSEDFFDVTEPVVDLVDAQAVVVEEEPEILLPVVQPATAVTRVRETPSEFDRIFGTGL